jgi:hypothetical protein
MEILRPKKPAWLIASVALAGASLVAYVVLASVRPWQPGYGASVVFGAAAAVVVLLQALYPLRRRLLAFPFGTAQRWIQFHIYGGMVAFVFVLIHEGFRRPGGVIGWTLLVLSGWAAASGLIGVWLQKWIPTASAGLDVEALFERIPALVQQLQNEASRLVDGSSEMLERFYRDDVSPALAGVQTSWDYLLDVRSGRERRLARFERMTSFLAESERPRLEDLKNLFKEKLELDAQFSLQRALRIWTFFHVPPSALLLGLMIFHVGSSLLYR